MTLKTARPPRVFGPRGEAAASLSSRDRAVESQLDDEQNRLDLPRFSYNTHWAFQTQMHSPFSPQSAAYIDRALEERSRQLPV